MIPYIRVRIGDTPPALNVNTLNPNLYKVSLPTLNMYFKTG